jgi:hypothetical protein
VERQSLNGSDADAPIPGSRKPKPLGQNVAADPTLLDADPARIEQIAPSRL